MDHSSFAVVNDSTRLSRRSFVPSFQIFGLLKTTPSRNVSEHKPEFLLPILEVMRVVSLLVCGATVYNSCMFLRWSLLCDEETADTNIAFVYGDVAIECDGRLDEYDTVYRGV